MKWTPRRRTLALYTASILPALAVAMRLQALATTDTPSDGAHFGQHPTLAMLHLLPGALFLFLGPLQFHPWSRRHLAVHRFVGRLFVASTACVGATALCMDRVFPSLGPSKTAANWVFGLLLLAFLGRGMWVIVARRDVQAHRRNMVRAYAVGMGIATQSVVMIPLYAMFGAPEPWAVGASAWVGFSTNLLLAEGWLRRRPPV